MQRRLPRILPALAIFVACFSLSGAAGPTESSDDGSILQRFLALDAQAPISFRALRHLDAHNDQFDSSAWMDVWTEGDPTGFRYEVVAEGGSDYIRSRVLLASLDI